MRDADAGARASRQFPRSIRSNSAPSAYRFRFRHPRPGPDPRIPRGASASRSRVLVPISSPSELPSHSTCTRAVARAEQLLGRIDSEADKNSPGRSTTPDSDDARMMAVI